MSPELEAALGSFSSFLLPDDLEREAAIAVLAADSSSTDW
jgi:hypothetical protein